MERRGWLRGCAIGCGVVLVVGIALLAVGALKVAGWFANFDEAIAARSALDEAYGSIEDHVPPRDGRVPAERVERFLAVREALVPECARLSEVVASLQSATAELHSLDELEAEPGVRDVPWRVVPRTIGSAFSLVPAIGRFTQARNAALIEQEMGLGEYAWLFLAFYPPAPASAKDHESGIDFEGTGPDLRKAFLGMLRRQRAALGSAQDGGQLAARLDEELEAMEQDPARPPWLEGLPEPLARSLEPFAGRAEELACPDLGQLELARPERRRGMTISVN